MSLAARVCSQLFLLAAGDEKRVRREKHEKRKAMRDLLGDKSQTRSGWLRDVCAAL